MHWFRSRLRHGSLLALLALAINFALSFGHVHAPNGKVSEGDLSLLLAVAPSHHGGQTQGHDHDGHPDDLCPICMARAAMGNAIMSTPPVLMVAFVDVPVVRATEFFLAIPQPPRAAFHSRGPPVS